MADQEHRRTRRIVGGVVWLLIAILVVITARSLSAAGSTSTGAATLFNYWFARDVRIQRQAVKQLVMPGDPVFHRFSDKGWAQVGFVESVSVVGRDFDDQTSDGSKQNKNVNVTIRWHSSEIDPTRVRLVGHRNLGSMNETIQILFPPEKREIIRQQIAAAMRQHGDTLANQFLPLIEQSVRKSIPVIEAELMVAIARHKNELNQLSSRWKEEWVNNRLVPLAKDQVLPIAQTHAEPLVREIGRELWNRASLWSFTWRAVYDKTPLPRKDLMREEWERFVREEAIPVIESHSEEIATAIQRTLSDVAKNPKIRGEVGSAVSSLVDDPQSRQLMSVLLRETLIDNPKVRQVWIDVWTSNEAQAAFNQAGDLVEPLVRKLGDEIIGSPDRGIDPGFARVLRHQILGKDRRWVIAELVDDPSYKSQRIEVGFGDANYPLLPMAELQELE
jgi:hypothetical protein